MNEKSNMKNVNIVIPSGGLGTRFSGSEFIELKPFIKFFDKTMFEWLLIGFNSKKYNISFFIIINEKFKDIYSKDIKYLEDNYQVKFKYINLVTEGTTATALFLFDELNNSTPTLLANCDQIIDINFDDYLDEHFLNDADGSMLCFDKEDSNKWSFVRISENNRIIEVRAKENITDIAICGWYFWTKGSDFIKYGIQQIINLDRVGNEYYLCPVFNYAIKNNKKIIAIIIDKTKMHGVGTPEDLRKYLSLKD